MAFGIQENQGPFASVEQRPCSSCVWLENFGSSNEYIRFNAKKAINFDVSPSQHVCLAESANGLFRVFACNGHPSPPLDELCFFGTNEENGAANGVYHVLQVMTTGKGILLTDEGLYFENTTTAYAAQ